MDATVAGILVEIHASSIRHSRVGRQPAVMNRGLPTKVEYPNHRDHHQVSLNSRARHVVGDATGSLKELSRLDGAAVADVLVLCTSLINCLTDTMSMDWKQLPNAMTPSVVWVVVLIMGKITNNYRSR